MTTVERGEEWGWNVDGESWKCEPLQQKTQVEDPGGSREVRPQQLQGLRPERLTECDVAESNRPFHLLSATALPGRSARGYR